MIYTFKNNKTGEVFEKHMRMAEKEPYLEENPDMSLVITAVPCNTKGYGDASYIHRTPDAFNDRLKEIKKTVPKEFADKIDTK